jgi:hypothetical protein
VFVYVLKHRISGLVEKERRVMLSSTHNRCRMAARSSAVSLGSSWMISATLTEAIYCRQEMLASSAGSRPVNTTPESSIEAKQSVGFKQ